MERILIGKNVNYAASKTNAAANSATVPMDLAEGAVGVFGTLDGAVMPSLVTAGNAAAFDGKTVIVSVGTKTGALTTGFIDLNGKGTSDVKVYAASAKKALTLTITPKAAEASEEDDYIVKVVHTNFFEGKEEAESFSVQGKFATDTALCDALRARIAEQGSNLVNASGTTTLILTAKEFDMNIEAALDGEYATKSIAVSTALKVGNGNEYQVKALEADLQAIHGTHDTRASYVTKPKQDVVGNYDIYRFTYANDQFPSGSQKKVFDIQNIVNVAFMNGVLKKDATSGAVIAGQNQKDFDDIAVSLGLTATSLV